MWGPSDTGLPKARDAKLVMERVDDELVIFDTDSNQAHCLSAVAAAVFQAADGSSKLRDIAHTVSVELKQPVDVKQVEQALEELDECGLLETAGSPGISRRAFMRGSAALGGVAIAGTMIGTVAAPAYGGVPSFDTGSFSGMQILVTLTDGSTYGAKWGTKSSEATLTRSPTTGICGTGSWANSSCGVQKPSGSGCLSGTNGVELSAQATPATGTVTGIQVNLPALSSGSYSSVTMYMFCGGTCTTVTSTSVSGKSTAQTVSFTLTPGSGCFS